MKISEFLKQAGRKLGQSGISSARLDSLILVEDILHKDRAWVLAHPEHELNNQQARRLWRKVERRAGHVPLAYIRGHTEFYGRQFKVNRHVLEPRPETETMIELLLQLKLPDNPAIADIGTGNGAIGITAALEIPDSRVDLYEISSGALAVAKHNVHLHELRLHARKMNLLSRPLRPYDVILANLPYVPDKWQINQAALAEPRIAIFGGSDGLEIYRKLFTQLQRFTWQPAYVLTECLPPQQENLAAIAASHGFGLNHSRDFIQTFTPV
jgi:release factor glutamine methyltransferase